MAAYGRQPAGPRLSSELAIHVDEVGIVFGRHREFLLKSSYQLLFRVGGDSLVPFACEALAIAFTRGRAVPAQQLFARVEPARREALEQVCRMLHFRNYGNIGIPGLEFFFNVDPGVPLPDPGHIEWLGRETLPDPSLAVCEITEGAGASSERVGAFAEDLKRIGVRLAVDDFGAGESTLDRVRLIEPDTVKIDAGWFRAAARNPESSALLPDLFSGLRDWDARCSSRVSRPRRTLQPRSPPARTFFKATISRVRRSPAPSSTTRHLASAFCSTKTFSGSQRTAADGRTLRAQLPEPASEIPFKPAMTSESMGT